MTSFTVEVDILTLKILSLRRVEKLGDHSEEQI